MVLCIEPMINMGKKFIRQEKDGWTIITQDNMPSAHYELAIAVSITTPVMLSSFEKIEEAIRQEKE
jgi:methionyl aminopeptidase